MMKKFILILLGLIVCLVGLSGLVLEKIILSQMPKVLAQLNKGDAKVSFSSVEGDSGFASTKLIFKDPRVETKKGVYQTDYVSFKVSLFSFRTLEGAVSGHQQFNQVRVQSAPIVFKIEFGEKKKITAKTEKMLVSNVKRIAFFQKAQMDATIEGKNIFVSFNGEKVSLPIVPIKRFSEMEKLSFDLSHQRGSREVVIKKSNFDFGNIYLSVQGRVYKDGFTLNTQVRGWEDVLGELTEAGFINKGSEKVIYTTLKLLSVRGVLTAPLVLENGVLRVGGYPIMDLMQKR